ncbi:hypothetical protein [Kocuria rosea]|uniref:hypothetical protein n=1 Tax=Kocuria rosea TaxID=1275 RepID=UPI002040D05D|nr:hypothetical protein [Kocuria rosea]
MNTKKRVIIASTAAVAGLFLSACDNNEAEETPQTPTETTQMEEGATTDPGATEDGAGTETETGEMETETDAETEN